ncbi:Sodium:dicarboxylate symporter precursor [Sphingopyxis sp. LC81]|jgi:proton glutamate symport protein|uniref:dicarboxylate/amino acid:cation symporter n=1 Tax=Sphingopyxis sp. LC81 TaxID=1502850 RepID=UPI00050FB51A|nr:cation:dicarboxylase symporter family transporter [Sphingopyxis sp. LC81]KGB55963.1 Sodium:dicarboxylate symporter precursor [Sphingopyxis sp. LC81]
MARTWLILSALVAGLALGVGWTRFGLAGLADAVVIADSVGGIWLDGLRMTIIPLVVSLLITGIAKTVDSARGDRVAMRSVVTFVALLWISTAMAAVLVPTLLGIFPMPAEAARSLAASISTGHGHHVDAPTVGVGAFLRSIVPTNPVAAAANDALLPLILFTAVFAVALARLPAAQREPVTAFFDTIASAVLLIVGWVLALAPIGVLALAFGVGARAGTSAIGALAHYVVIVSSAGLAAWALAYPVAVFGGRVRLLAFAKAVAPAQAVALSTQSSLASLPPMLKASADLGVERSVSRVSLPVAVAIFRVTSPAMNLAVAIYVAHWLGLPLAPSAIAAGAAVAAITTIGSVSLPGQVSFLTSIAPICVAMGIPIEPLALLIAVEMIPDLVRTVGNVTMDVAATTAIARMGTAQVAAGEDADGLEVGEIASAPRAALSTAGAQEFEGAMP